VDITGKNKGFTAKRAKDAMPDLVIELFCNLVIQDLRSCRFQLPNYEITQLPNSFEPIHPHLKLHGVDTGIWDRQTGVGNVLVANARSEGAAVVMEELKAESRVRYKVHVRRIQWNSVIAEKHSATQLEIRDSAGRVGKVPLQVKRVKGSRIGVYSWMWLPNVIERNQVGRPFKIAAEEAAAMIVGEHLAQPNASVESVSIFCSAGNTESSASPYAEIPGLAV
jgi:hypothetical protein